MYKYNSRKAEILQPSLDISEQSDFIPGQSTRNYSKAFDAV